jgi:hypothetical protein
MEYLPTADSDAALLSRRGIGMRRLIKNAREGWSTGAQLPLVAAACREGLTPAMLKTPVVTQRVLFATGTYPDPNEFNDDFAALTPQLLCQVERFQEKRSALFDVPITDFELSMRARSAMNCSRSGTIFTSIRLLAPASITSSIRWCSSSGSAT